MSDLSLLFHHLKQPEYIHVLLNPLPVYGMMAGAFILGCSLLLRRDKESAASLIWIAFMGFATGLVVYFGQRGYDRVTSMSNVEAQQWLDVHMHRAELTQYVFYATGLMALVTLLSQWKWPKLSRVLAWVSLLMTLVCVGLAGWISLAGGQVRHSEFREGPPSISRFPQGEGAHQHSHGKTLIDPADEVKGKDKGGV